NGPLLVRADTGRIITEADVSAVGSSRRLLAWDSAAGAPVVYDATHNNYERDGADLALFGSYSITTPHGDIECRTAFELCAHVARIYTPAVVKEITGVDEGKVEQAARLLWESRPVAYYAWSGLEQQTNSTQTFRALSLLYALTGSFDARGGNVMFAAIPT